MLLPAYGGSYSASEDYLKQILEKLTSIDQRLERIEKGGGGSQQGTQEAALDVVARKCVSCHQDPADKGDGFVMVEKNGELSVLSLGQKRSIIRMTGQGKMPPAKPLTDGEKKLLAEYFDPAKQPPEKEKPK